ncbi:MAG: hypothetical protein LBU82_01370, partial [Treponema sp.]|nr:hypothetical protein [Treponema sp.]
MKWFNNLKIKSKMIIGFMLIIVMLVCMALFAINRLGKVADIYSNIIKYPESIKDANLKTQSAYRDLCRIMNAIIVYTPLGDSAMINDLYQEAVSAYESAMTSIQENENLVRRSPLMNEEEKGRRIERIDTLKNYIQRYKDEACDTIMSAAFAGDYNRCIEVIRNMGAFVDEIKLLTVELYEMASIVEERVSNNAL